MDWLWPSSCIYPWSFSDAFRASWPNLINPWSIPNTLNAFQASQLWSLCHSLFQPNYSGLISFHFVPFRYIWGCPSAWVGGHSSAVFMSIQLGPLLPRPCIPADFSACLIILRLSLLGVSTQSRPLRNILSAHSGKSLHSSLLPALFGYSKLLQISFICIQRGSPAAFRHSSWSIIPAGLLRLLTEATRANKHIIIIIIVIK